MPKHWACVVGYAWNLGPIFWYLEQAVYLEFGPSLMVDDEWELGMDLMLMLMIMMITLIIKRK